MERDFHYPMLTGLSPLRVIRRFTRSLTSGPREISRGACKLAPMPTVIKKKKKRFSLPNILKGKILKKDKNKKGKTKE